MKLGQLTPSCTGPGLGVPGFAAWFAGSVVVDSAGCPLVVWHGHSIHVDAFEHFDFDRVADIGAHFGTRVAAEHFGDPRPFYLSLRRTVALHDPGDWLSGGWRNAADVPVLDDMAGRGLISETEYEQAKAQVRAARHVEAQRQRTVGRDRARQEARATASRIIRALIEAKGYDGVVYENRSEDVGSRSWIAFHPWQIKNIYARRFARTSSIFDGWGHR